jgi:hypothetical protein
MKRRLQWKCRRSLWGMLFRRGGRTLALVSRDSEYWDRGLWSFWHNISGVLAWVGKMYVMLKHIRAMHAGVGWNGGQRLSVA